MVLIYSFVSSSIYWASKCQGLWIQRWLRQGLGPKEAYSSVKDLAIHVAYCSICSNVFLTAELRSCNRDFMATQSGPLQKKSLPTTVLLEGRSLWKSWGHSPKSSFPFNKLFLNLISHFQYHHFCVAFFTWIQVSLTHLPFFYNLVYNLYNYSFSGENFISIYFPH